MPLNSAPASALVSRVPSPLLVLGSCVSLQFGAALATPLLHELGPGLTTTMRLLGAGILLLAAYRPKVHSWDRRQWRAVLAFGVTLAVMNGCFYAAIARIPLGIAVTIEFVGPLALAAVLSRRARDLACVAAAATAIAVLGFAPSVAGSGAAASGLDPIGVAFALAAAAAWAGYILTGRHLGTQISGHGPLAVGICAGVLVVAPFGVGGVPALVHDPAALLPLAGVALLSSLVPYSLEFAAMRRLSAGAFGVLLSLEPAVAAIAGWALLGQSLTWITMVAVAVVVTASTVSSLGGARDYRRSTDVTRSTAEPASSEASRSTSAAMPQS